jgi:CheY-like chemotaxis protein
VLDLAKIESSSIRLSLESVNFADLVDEAWRVLEPVAVTRGISLHRDLPMNAAVTADRGRLKQVLLNLLSNAINFNREGGDISIQAHKVTGGRLRIEITDSGQGISAERLPMIFEAFNRRGTAQGQVGGTGIGLIITRKLIDLMDGDVGVESQLGVGTTFWIDLPLAIAVASNAAGTLANGSAMGSTASPSATAKTTQPMPSDDIPANFDARIHDHCVLCIDDNPINLKLIGQLLAKRPRIHLICAHSPGLGIQLALGRQPDLILLDINMPGMDGYQVAEVLKTYARTKSIPIIAVTANAAPRSNALGGTTGLADYLTKPLDAEKFLSTVDRWLDKSGVSSPN